MRIADPAELNPEQPLESVLTATMPREVVGHFSSAMRDVDPYDSPGPAKIAVLKLDAGPIVAIVYHELKNLIEVMAPVDTTLEQALREVVEVLRIPRSSIEWVRGEVALSRLYHQAEDTSGPSSVPKYHHWRVAVSPALAERQLSASESISLTLLVTRLAHIAGEIAPIDDPAVRMIEMPKTILFADGSEAAPLAVYYKISDDDSTALIVDVKHLAANDVQLASGTLISAIQAAPVGEYDRLPRR